MKTSNTKFMITLLTAATLITSSGLAISKGKPAKDATQKHNNQPVKQWYLSNSVSVYDPVTEQTHKSINPAVLGKLAESSDGYDKHDIRPYASLANSKAAVLFIQENWGNRSGEFNSNYHGSKRQSDSWEMTVFSTVKEGKVTLNWNGLFELTPTNAHGRLTYAENKTLNSRTLKRLQLIDLETLEVIPAVSAEGELNSYTFTMETGKTSRQFRWVLGSINASHFDPASGAMKYIKEHQPEVLRQRRGIKKGGKFGLPPS
ncbi:hypothetical protein [Methyloprofundus sp.]|uniref:hypothetical protein n=1 Tax=Methyloprofundus sp. TaxID=2020875 RepID=UPI003D13BFC0